MLANALLLHRDDKLLGMLNISLLGYLCFVGQGWLYTDLLMLERGASAPALTRRCVDDFDSLQRGCFWNIDLKFVSF